MNKIQYLNIDELRKEAKSINEEIQKVDKEIIETDVARRLNESARHKQESLRRKYYKITEQINKLDRYSANKELQELVGKIIAVHEDDSDKFKWFRNAEAEFTDTNEKQRKLHIKIECSQICDHDVKKMLSDIEQVAERKIIDWFISASIGYNSHLNSSAWLTYNLTFEGENK